MLAEQLRAEKAVADAARQEAEIANRAKTQFFTAASHDLRQPLHAMGLFAEALRAAHPRARGGAARQQHQRIGRRARGPVLRAARHHPDRQRRGRGQSAELLDRRHLPQASPALRADGVREGALPALSRRPARRARRPAAGRADPPQPGRRTRSATPTTARCWSAPGARRAHPLQVWDTGPGIGDEERARVFEEFYQVPGTPTAALGEQKKGLGLGLAIVKRLARADAGAARAALQARPRLGLHARAAGRHGAAPAGSASSRARGRSASRSTAG